MIATAAALGAGIGIGLLLVARAVRPRPTPLAAVLAGLAPPALESSPTTPLTTVAGRLVAPLNPVTPTRSVELRVAELRPDRHALDKLVGLVGGIAGAAVVTSGLGGLGFALPIGAAVIFCLLCGAAGFVLPDIALADRVKRRQRAFRHALSAYLDLVNIILAGGGGIETALHSAADAGDGWAFAAIRHALDRARLTGRSPWDSLAQLGDELGIDELAELAANVSLAGSHGARIRRSLAAKADSLRGHQIAETESAAEAATERMTVPVAVLLFGFLVFIAYPAIQQITTVTSSAP
jgi:tight adherence protein C